MRNYECTKFSNVESLAEMKDKFKELIGDLERTCPKTCANKAEVDGLINDLWEAHVRIVNMHDAEKD